MRLNRILLVALGLSMATGAAAQDYHGVAYGGGSFGQGTNVYAGAVVSLPGARLGHGLAVRGTAIAGNYRYESNGIGIRGRYKGAEVAAVYQLSGDWGWTNLSAGPRVTDTRLSPKDPDNKLRGTRWDLGVQADGAFNFSPAWRMTYLGSVGILDGGYLFKANVGPLIDAKSQTRIGIEGAFQGDPKYKAKSAGAFVSTQVAKAAELQFSAGIRDQESRKAGAYGAIGASFLF